MSFVVSAHQPNLQPGSAFFYKLAQSDIMDLRMHAQLTERGYQRRVKMRDKWVNLVLAEGTSKTAMLDTIRIKNKESRTQIINTMKGRYNNAPFRRGRLDEVCDMVNEQTSDWLWQFNLGLILDLRDWLGITTPISISGPVSAPKAEGIIAYVKRYPGATAYLSGTGAMNYMDDVSPFTEAGLDVIWSRHDAVTGDSVVSLMMDYEDPMEMIMREKPEESQ